MSKIKIQIKNRWTGSILFECEKEDSTIKDTVIEAVKSGTSLRGADLSGASLRGADLSGASLRGANLSGADLIDAYLGYADLIDADLDGADLRGAHLIDANLRYAHLIDANLNGAYLDGARLCDANLSGADLSGAYLGYADLRGACLHSTNLRDSIFRSASLRGARLIDANLGGTDFSYADISYADFRGAKEIPYAPLACPSDGAFVGWKKVGDKLIKLEIPEDAKRCSANSRKCRCDKAKVLAITDLNGENPIDEIKNINREPHTLYKVGEMVLPDSFDENRWNECSNGIHFFINKQDAINYIS